MLLKEKMNQLSDSVDCFDKISARAFPEKSTDFSDSELFVDELENITGRRRHFPWFKCTAIAAALVLCITVIPKTTFVNNLFANIGKDRNKIFNDLISEISYETENHDYTEYDVTLNEYIADDFLITPLYSCPFEKSERNDIRVRIYIRKADSMLTNQIYAVEYSGSYTESNIIAAAESSAKFTEEEIEKYTSDLYENTDKLISSVSSLQRDNVFDSLDLQENEEYYNMAASFTFESLIKDKNEIYPLAVYSFYYSIHDGDSISYCYDMEYCTYDDNGFSVESEAPCEFRWKNSVYFGGTSAMPEKSESHFYREQILNISYENDDEVNYVTVQPLKDHSGESKKLPLKISCMDSNGTTLLGELEVVYDQNARKTTDVYVISKDAEFDESTVIIAECDEFINTFELSLNSQLGLLAEGQRQAEEAVIQEEMNRQQAETAQQALEAEKSQNSYKSEYD